MTRTSKEQEVLNKLLIEAVEGSDLSRMKIYVAKGADVHVNVASREVVYNNGTYTSSGTSPLFHHMLNDHYRQDIADFMLQQGVDIDVKNFNGNTPLMLAVKNRSTDRVKYFLSKGADPVAVNSRGEMVLDEARKLSTSYSSRQEIIDMLVAALENPAEKTPPAPKPAAALQETTRDIQVLKPLALSPRKKGGGFNL